MRYTMFRTLATALIGLTAIGCSTQSATPYYGAETTANRTNTQGLWVHQLAEAMSGKANALSVATEDRDRHQKCVFFALEQLNLGEECVWKGDYGASGIVQVTAVYPSGHKVCHIFFTTLTESDQDVKRWKDTACWDGNRERWSFVSEY